MLRSLYILALTVLICIPMNVMADEVLTYGSADGLVFDKINTKCIYFTAPVSKTGASKVVLKSIQLYTFLDGSGSASNLQGKTVYLLVSSKKMATSTKVTTGMSTGEPFQVYTDQSQNTSYTKYPITGISAGVTYNSEGYTTFTFTNGLQLDPGTEYCFFVTRQTSATQTSGNKKNYYYTCYNIRMRVFSDETNQNECYYAHKANGLLQWMPCFIATLTDATETVYSTIPNPPLLEESIRENATSTRTDQSLRYIGFTTPNLAGVTSYHLSSTDIYFGNAENYNSYLAIATTNLGNQTTLPAKEIVAISTNMGENSTGYSTYNFRSDKLRPNTTYYLYFVSGNDANQYQINARKVTCVRRTYRPTVYSGTDNVPSESYFPAMRMTVTNNTADDPYVDGEMQTLWSSNNNEHPWRIPTLARTKKGTLVALGGYLLCDKDVGNGQTAIAAKYSTDNGYTWSSTGNVLAEGDASTGYGYGDAAIVADRESGKILVMCVYSNVGYTVSTRNKPIGVARIYGQENSTGDITWSTPENVTNSIYGLNSGLKGLFFASGRILQSRVVKKGEYYRIYSAIACNYSTNSNYVLYSDDFGATWNILGNTTALASGGDESKVEEMPNGDILFSCRTDNGRKINLFKFTDINSDDTAGSWQGQQTLSLGSGQACNGEILFVNAKKKDDSYCILALQSLPSEAATTYLPRRKVAIYYKELASDDLSSASSFASGTWTKYEVSGSGSAYSTMVAIPETNTIGFMLENNYVDLDGKAEPRCDLQYVNLPLSMITDGDYTEIVSEYDMPYRETYAEKLATDMRFDKVTLTREDITDSERYYTFCSPFDLTADEVAAAGITSVETLGSYIEKSNTLKFKDVEDGIKAFQPYVIKASGVNVSRDNALIVKNTEAGSVTAGEATFTANLIEPYQLSQNGTVNAYGYSAKTGKFAKASATAIIHSFCAYVTLPNSNQAKSLNLEFETTGISSIVKQEENVTVYNLSGQKVLSNAPAYQLNSLPKGIYVINNKKQVIK